jgi:hypothetical protein
VGVWDAWPAQVLKALCGLSMTLFIRSLGSLLGPEALSFGVGHIKASDGVWAVRAACFASIRKPL